MRGQIYTRAEDKKILRYIIANQEYSRVAGDQLWQKMEEQKVVEGRTAQA